MSPFGPVEEFDWNVCLEMELLAQRICDSTNYFLPEVAVPVFTHTHRI